MEITCPHCEARHAADAAVCPVCGTPVASALMDDASNASAPRAAAPAEPAGVATPMARASTVTRRNPPVLIAP